MKTDPAVLDKLERLDEQFQSVHHPGELDLPAIRKQIFKLLYEQMPFLIADARALATAEATIVELTRQRDVAQQAANANAAVTVRERKEAEAKLAAVLDLLSRMHHRLENIGRDALLNDWAEEILALITPEQ